MIESLLCDDNCIISGPIRPNIITPVEEYITFVDSAVKALCVANWGSNGEITYEQATAVTDLGSVFTNNTSIISFDELRFFTGLTLLNKESFTNCINLSSIILPDSIQSFENGDPEMNGCFYGCTCLPLINIPNTVSLIGNQTFVNCANLSSINIPSLVISIGDYAFYGCTGLTSVIVEATTPPTLGTNVFTNDTNLTHIHVPSASVDTYKAAIGWSEYASIISAIV